MSPDAHAALRSIPSELVARHEVEGRPAPCLGCTGPELAGKVKKFELRKCIATPSK